MNSNTNDSKLSKRAASSREEQAAPTSSIEQEASQLYHKQHDRNLMTALGILVGKLEGYTDAEVAGHLGTTEEEVRLYDIEHFTREVFTPGALALGYEAFEVFVTESGVAKAVIESLSKHAYMAFGHKSLCESFKESGIDLAFVELPAKVNGILFIDRPDYTCCLIRSTLSREEQAGTMSAMLGKLREGESVAVIKA